MTDRFLRDHRMAAHTFRLCGPFDPSSSRDMCVRGEELAMRLLVAKEITRDSRVLIVGAGVAGITCAATLLARSFCHVTLNDRKGAPLNRQTGVFHRDVLPHGFDWPYFFYKTKNHPLIEPSVMPWTGAKADDVALQFNERLKKIAANFGTGRFWKTMSNRIIDWHYDPMAGWRVEFTKPPHPKENRRQSYDILILCSGFAEENDELCNYRGYRFWDPKDAFLGRKLYRIEAKDNILICGAGDGALIEFIRLVTGESIPKKLLKQIEPFIDLIARERYQAVQALSHRHYLISASSNRDDEINAFSFECHQRLARYLYRKTDLKLAMQRMLLPGRPGVQLLIRSMFFTHCYTPNAMLVSLLARALCDNGNNSLTPLLFSSEVCSVQSTGAGPPPKSADDWAASSVKTTVRAYARPATPSKELNILLDNGVAEISADFVRKYRCMFLRIGISREIPRVLRDIRRAIRRSVPKVLKVREIRHALPQSPL